MKIGLEICLEQAELIKKDMFPYLKVDGRVPPKVASIYKNMARDDAKFHADWDPEFDMGGGRAAERHG